MSANRGEFAYYSDTLELTKKETKEISELDILRTLKKY